MRHICHMCATRCRRCGAPSCTSPWIRRVPGQGPAQGRISHSRRQMRFRISNSGPTGRVSSRFRDRMHPCVRRREPGRPRPEARWPAPGEWIRRMRERFPCELIFKTRSPIQSRALAARRARRAGSGGRDPDRRRESPGFAPPEEGCANASHLQRPWPESGRGAPRVSLQSLPGGGARELPAADAREAETSVPPRNHPKAAQRSSVRGGE